MLLAMSINNSEKQVLEEIINLMMKDDSMDAPEDAVKWSKNLLRARAAAAQPKKSLVQKVLAILQIDLAPNKVAFGERSAQGGGATAQERQMLFQAGEATAVDLRIRQGEKGFSLRGQLMGENFANCTVRLGEMETVANEMSEFCFSNVPNGVYTMTFATEKTEIEIENLEIK